MYKLILCDFYNTIIDREECIPSSTIISIDEFRRENKKNKFSICTDLGYEDVLFYDKSFHFIDYVIAYSGSVIYDLNKEKIIYKKNILISILKRIISVTKSGILYGLDNKYEIDSDYLEFIKNNKVYRLDIIYNKINLKLVNELGVNYYIKDNYIIITGSSLYDCIMRLIGKSISISQVLCICGDNKFNTCLDSITCLGISNSSLKTKKIKLDNNNKGVENIIKKIK